MRFTQYFRLGRSQREIDFIDIDIDKDIPLFIDAFAIQMRQDEWWEMAISMIKGYFEFVISLIRDDSNEQARKILINKEPKEICLWDSQYSHSWRAIKEEKSKNIFDAFKRSRAVESGLLKDLEDSILFIDNIGPDTISDLTANIIKVCLIEYTKAQCHLYGIATENVPINLLWDDVNLQWTYGKFSLPVCNGKAIILVPKNIVRLDSTFRANDYYNNYVLEFHRLEHLHASSPLVEVLKNWRKRVTKKSLREVYPYSKTYLADFTLSQSSVLEEYRRDKKLSFWYTSDETIESIQNEPLSLVDYNYLMSQFDAIPTGRENANQFHDTIVNIINAIFIPEILSSPIKENPIHEWRKRIDITYLNIARSWFFYTLQDRVPSWRVFIECKNYEWDPQNPELDQLSWRFSPTRWQFGLLICRNITNKELFNSRCRDTAKDTRGYIMALNDADIIALLEYKKNGQDNEIDRFFSDKWNELFADLMRI